MFLKEDSYAQQGSIDWIKTFSGFFDEAESLENSIQIFDILNVFTLIFDLLNAYLLNKNIN